MKGCLGIAEVCGVKGISLSCLDRGIWPGWNDKDQLHFPDTQESHETQTSLQEMSQNPGQQRMVPGLPNQKGKTTGSWARKLGKSHHLDCLHGSVSPSNNQDLKITDSVPISPAGLQLLREGPQCLAHSRHFEGMEELGYFGERKQKSTSFLFRPLVASRCSVSADAQETVLLKPNKLPDIKSILVCFLKIIIIKKEEKMNPV